MAHTYMTRYKVGDRVKLTPVLAASCENCIHGIVVYYRESIVNPSQGYAGLQGGQPPLRQQT